jgi:ABC-type oligopeptide transport system ATPase subunit
MPAGGKVGLVGRPGGGKTTLTRLLLRFSDVDAGAIRIGGQDISKIAQAALRDSIAIVPQEPAMFHRTIADNIRFGRPSATDDEVRHAARLAHASEFIDQLPAGYADQRAMITPVSALAIALVVSVHGLEGTTYDLVTGDEVHVPFWIATVVLGGAIINEFLVTITSPKRPAGRAPTIVPPIGRDPTAPVQRTEPDDLADDHDDLDDDVEEAGPVYAGPDDHDDHGDKR